MTLIRQAVAELVGTAFLLAAVVGSGIAAVRLAPDAPGLQLLVNSLVTGAALVALILALHPVSASFNPIVTLVEVARGVIGARTAGVLVVAQVCGAFVGVVLANLMFGLEVVSVSGTDRVEGGRLLAEVVAVVGLVLVVVGSAERVAYAVGAYIAAAYWFTSSTAFANPAVTFARMFSDTFAGIAPGSVPPYLVMQVIGGGIAVGLAALLFPVRRGSGR